MESPPAEEQQRRESVLDFGTSNTDFSNCLSSTTDKPQANVLEKDSFGQVITLDQARILSKEWQSNRMQWKYRAFVSRNLFAFCRPLVEKKGDYSSVLHVDELKTDICPLISSFLRYEIPDISELKLDELTKDQNAASGNVLPERPAGLNPSGRRFSSYEMVCFLSLLVCFWRSWFPATFSFIFFSPFFSSPSFSLSFIHIPTFHMYPFFIPLLSPFSPFLSIFLPLHTEHPPTCPFR